LCPSSHVASSCRPIVSPLAYGLVVYHPLPPPDPFRVLATASLAFIASDSHPADVSASQGPETSSSTLTVMETAATAVTVRCPDVLHRT
jgi:hypothetical protein